MTKATEKEMKVEYAKRSLSRIAEDAKKDIRKQIDWIRRRLEEAEACLEDEDRAPSRCGVIQSAACELEMAVGRLIAMRDANAAVRILAEAATTATASTGGG
jgi:hypothetical protein